MSKFNVDDHVYLVKDFFYGDRTIDGGTQGAVVDVRETTYDIFLIDGPLPLMYVTVTDDDIALVRHYKVDDHIIATNGDNVISGKITYIPNGSNYININNGEDEFSINADNWSIEFTKPPRPEWSDKYGTVIQFDNDPYDVWARCTGVWRRTGSSQGEPYTFESMMARYNSEPVVLTVGR